MLTGSDSTAEHVRKVVRRLDAVALPHNAERECFAALSGLANRGKLPRTEIERAIAILGEMKLYQYGHAQLARRIWELCHNMWPYDASYVTLTELLDAPLITVDTKFSRTPSLHCSIYTVQKRD